LPVFNPVSLRRKLILGILGTALAALFLELAGFLAIDAVGSRTSALRELSVLAEVLSEGSVASLDFNYPKEAEQILATLHAQRAIEGARIYDRRGLPFASYHRQEGDGGALPRRPPALQRSFEGARLGMTWPIRHGGETLGSLYLVTDLSERAARLRWTLAFALGLTLVIAGFAVLFALRLANRVAEPILNLAAAARGAGDRANPGQRVVNTSRDEVGVLVTAFNRMLDQLEERQARLEEAQRMAHLGSWSMDLGSSTMAISEEVALLFGLPGGATAVQVEILKALVHPEDLPLVVQLAAKTRADGSSFAVDFRILAGDQAVRWGHAAGACFREDPLRPLLRGTVMDITERKKAETSLRQVQKLESLGVLAGGIAHDFNNLLGAILGNLGLARMNLPEDAPVGAYLGKAEAITLKAADLTRQMLAYSGRGRFEQKDLSLNQVVQEMGNLLAVSISKKAGLHYDLAPDPPFLKGDPAQLQQVVMNLVINASEALGEGAGTIQLRTGRERLLEEDLTRTYLGQELAEATYAVLEVADDGCGMDAATLERMFDPFFTTKFSGRGLGLAAMLGILKGHKGGIRVYSEPGRGTTFKLLFPCSGAGPEPVASVAMEDASPCTGRVLVVDDEAEIRTMASSVLERMGFVVETAVDGQDGLERFAALHGDLCFVLLDLTMPRMDGSACLRAMHALDPAVPVILSSGFNVRELRDEFVEGKMSHFVQKPYRPGTLMAAVREVLKGTAIPLGAPGAGME
jgi:signal transduction histidine kinase/ActR/RegA family two-component response regulator